MNKIFKIMNKDMTLFLLFVFCLCLVVIGVATQIFLICVIGTFIPFLYLIIYLLCLRFLSLD